MDYKIYESQVEEANQIISYMKQVLSETDFLSKNVEEFTFTEEKEVEFIDKTLKSDNDLMLSVRVENEIVGLLTYFGGSRMRTKHAGVLGISVAKDYWGKGIGKALMVWCLNWVHGKSHIRKVNLSVRDDNHRAIGLYKKMGFVVEGKETMTQYTNGRYYDSVNMGYRVIR